MVNDIPWMEEMLAFYSDYFGKKKWFGISGSIFPPLMFWYLWSLFLFPLPVHLSLDHLWLSDGHQDTYGSSFILFFYIFLYTLLELDLQVCPGLLAPSLVYFLFLCSFPSILISLSSIFSSHRPSGPLFSYLLLFLSIIQQVR